MSGRFFLCANYIIVQFLIQFRFQHNCLLGVDHGGATCIGIPIGERQGGGTLGQCPLPFLGRKIYLKKREEMNKKLQNLRSSVENKRNCEAVVNYDSCRAGYFPIPLPSLTLILTLTLALTSNPNPNPNTIPNPNPNPISEIAGVGRCLCMLAVDLAIIKF